MNYLTFIPSDFNNLNNPIQYDKEWNTGDVAENDSTRQYNNPDDCPVQRSYSRSIGGDFYNHEGAYKLGVNNIDKLNKIRVKLLNGAKSVRARI